MKGISKERPLLLFMKPRFENPSQSAYDFKKRKLRINLIEFGLMSDDDPRKKSYGSCY